MTRKSNRRKAQTWNKYTGMTVSEMLEIEEEKRLRRQQRVPVVPVAPVQNKERDGTVANSPATCPFEVLQQATEGFSKASREMMELIDSHFVIGPIGVWTPNTLALFKEARKQFDEHRKLRSTRQDRLMDVIDNHLTQLKDSLSLEKIQNGLISKQIWVFLEHFERFRDIVIAWIDKDDRRIKESYKLYMEMEHEMEELNRKVKQAEQLEERAVRSLARNPTTRRREKYKAYFRLSNGRVHKLVEPCNVETGNATLPMVKEPTIAGISAALSDNELYSSATFGNIDDMVAMDGTVCSICLVEYRHDDEIVRNGVSGIRYVKCNHMFHKDCMTTWTQHCHGQQHQETATMPCSNCPCCRRPFLINT